MLLHVELIINIKFWGCFLIYYGLTLVPYLILRYSVLATKMQEFPFILIIRYFVNSAHSSSPTELFGILRVLSIYFYLS